MAQLSIRRLTLFKQGIGYFERRGDVEGPTISLVVPREATNDVLKSLNIMVHGPGQVLSVDYETPADKARVLSDLPIQLENRSSLLDLLTSLRGADVTLQVTGQPDSHGRIIGVESSLDTATNPPVVLLQQESRVQMVPLSQVTSLLIHDQRAATNIGYFLDVSGTEHTHTALTVRLSEDTRDLAISYQAPSPTWRVSYRLVGAEHGQARLLAWGLFDNSLDEDLDDVQLTLISGRPISFEYALYESKVPHRPHVADLAEAVSAAANPLAAESIATISHELRTPLNSILGFSRVLLQGVDGELTAQQHQDIETIHKSGQHLLEQINNLLSAVHLKDDMSMAQPMLFRSGPLGDLKVSSSYLQPMIMENAEPEFLVYEVHTPITVRRGQSAMVPLIDTTTAYEEQRVYNGSKMPNHPLIVWRFANTTGVALEQGPVTISREGQYLGDSLIRFTGVSDEIQVPFALEFGILVTMDTRQNERREYFDVKLDAHKRQIQVKEYRRTDYIYTLTSRISEDMTILIERRHPSRGEFYAMPEPVYDAQEHTRWPVVVPANASTVFTVRERDITVWTGDVLQQPPETIEALHEARLLTEAAYVILHRLMGLMAQAKQDADESKELQAEYGQIISRQEQLRQNLRALGNSKREIGIRERILDDLEASENRRRGIEGVLSEINRVGKERAEEREALLDKLFGESVTTES